jgi:TATA-box binding protein (TBP) (component of TFIID and TFIIIB)
MNEDIDIDELLKILEDSNREDEAARKIQRVFRESRKRNAAARIIQKYFKYSREQWKLMLYNGVVKDASLGSYIREIWADITSKPLPRAIKEVSVLYDPSKKVITYTREYGVKGTSSNYNGLRWSIFFNGKYHSVALYKNGDIQFTGGYGNNLKTTATNTNQSKFYNTPSDVLKIALGRWVSKNIRVELNNITVQKRFPNSFSLSRIAEMYPNASYETEIIPFLYIKRSGFSVKVTTSGNITIQGSKTPESIRDAIQETNALVSTFPTRGIAQPKLTQSVKKIRRNNNIAPNVKSRATTCPKGKCPVPNTFEGKCPNGFYLAPNPQGFPCCYKIPVKTAYKRNGIISAFAKLGIAIPDHTKKVFQITNVNNTNKPKLVSNYVGNYKFRVEKNKKGGDVFKIDSRQCKRYTIPKLVDITLKLGLLDASRSRDKDTLCSSIFKYAANKGIINPENNIPRIGGRSCMHYTKDELRRVVRSKYGITLRSETLATMCAELKQRLRRSSSSNTTPKRRSSSSSLSSFGRNLEAAMRRSSSSSLSSFARNINATMINKAFQNLNVRRFLLKHTNRASVTNAEISNFKRRVYPKIKNANDDNVPKIMKNEAKNMFRNLPGPRKVGGIVIKETM